MGSRESPRLGLFVVAVDGLSLVAVEATVTAMVTVTVSGGAGQSKLVLPRQFEPYYLASLHLASPCLLAACLGARAGLVLLRAPAVRSFSPRGRRGRQSGDGGQDGEAGFGRQAVGLSPPSLFSG